MMMNEPKSKIALDKELTEALKQTFPASDPVAVDVDDAAVRPVDRRPPLINKALVNELARKAARRKRPGK